jgi:hypothetical protein
VLNGPPTALEEGAARPIMKLKTLSFRDGEGCPPPATATTSGQEHIAQWLLSLVEPGSRSVGTLLASASSKVGCLEERANWGGVVQCVLEDVAEQCSGGEEEEDGGGGYLREVYADVQDELRFKLFNLLAARLQPEHTSSSNKIII